MKKYIIVGIYFIITLLLSIYIFSTLPPARVHSEELDKVIISNVTYLNISSVIPLRQQSPQGFEEMFWTLIYSTWEPQKVCFVNKGSYGEYLDGTLSSSLKVSIYYNNEAKLVDDELCFEVEQDQELFTFNWIFSAKEDVKTFREYGETIQIHPNVQTYVDIQTWSGRIKIFVIIFLLTGVLLRSLKGCKEFILKGWND